jgi:hypothetical protein
VRVRNFRLLADAAGGEVNLAAALDVPMSRARDLAEGLGFSDEAAHHIETVLGLSSGFLDQVNPVLTPQTREALRQGHAGDASSGASGAEAARSLAAPATTSVPEPMPAPPAQPRPLSLVEAAPQDPGQARGPAQSQPPGTGAQEDEAAQIALRVVRRQNLAVLTQNPGAKSRLAQLVGMTPVNISHRLHGDKHFDRQTADLFCSRLGLAENWFDSPRTTADIPAQVLSLLTPLPRAGAASAEGATASATKRSAAAGKKAGKRASRKRETVPFEPAHAAVPARRGRPPRARETPAPPAPASAVGLALAPEAPTPSPAFAPAAKVKDAAFAPPSPITALPPKPPSAVQPQPAPSAPAVPALGPIAEALLKTLSLKAQAGRLTEAAALALLTEAAAL